MHRRPAPRHRKSWRNVFTRRTVHLIVGGAVLMHFGLAVAS